MNWRENRELEAGVFVIGYGVEWVQNEVEVAVFVFPLDVNVG